MYSWRSTSLFNLPTLLILLHKLPPIPRRMLHPDSGISRVDVASGRVASAEGPTNVAAGVVVWIFRLVLSLVVTQLGLKDLPAVHFGSIVVFFQIGMDPVPDTTEEPLRGAAGLHDPESLCPPGIESGHFPVDDGLDLVVLDDDVGEVQIRVRHHEGRIVRNGVFDFLEPLLEDLGVRDPVPRHEAPPDVSGKVLQPLLVGEANVHAPGRMVGVAYAGETIPQSVAVDLLWAWRRQLPHVLEDVDHLVLIVADLSTREGVPDRHELLPLGPRLDREIDGWRGEQSHLLHDGDLPTQMLAQIDVRHVPVAGRAIVGVVAQHPVGPEIPQAYVVSDVHDLESWRVRP